MAVPKEKEPAMKRLAIATLLAASAAAGFAQNPHGLPPGIAKKLAQQPSAAPARPAACQDCGTCRAGW